MNCNSEFKISAGFEYIYFFTGNQARVGDQGYSDNSKAQWICPLTSTGYSLTELLILATINPKYDNRFSLNYEVLKFIYSEKATKFCKISTIDLTVNT